MLFTILYVVMSVNRSGTKLWMLLHSLLDCFVQLKEKHVPISVVYGKRLRQICNLDINFRLFIVIYVTSENLTEQA